MDKHYSVYFMCGIKEILLNYSSGSNVRVKNFKEDGKMSKNTDTKYMEVVLGRVDELNAIVHHHLVCVEHAKHVRACLSEALTFAMQLDLLDSVKATHI